MSITIRLTVDETLEPCWIVKARDNADIDNKVISAQDRALIGANFITDYTDNQFAYNKLSPLYTLTKATIGDSKPIDQIKSRLLREMSQSVELTDMEVLRSPLSSLKNTAEKLGLAIDVLTPKIDIKDNPYTGNSITLHEDNLPYRLHGKGSKRLMSIAIQMNIANQGGIALIDEIEQGLEPDRIVTLVRMFKRKTRGQVFITTHSMNVILEANACNLFVLNKNNKALTHVDSDLDSCRRSNPQAFFGRKLIVCEGKTEQGFLREMDKRIEEKYDANFSTHGVVIVCAQGGNKMFTFANKLKGLGYDVCIFADNDRSNELEKYIKQSTKNDIPLFLCQENKCLEQDVFTSVSWTAVLRLALCNEDIFDSTHINIPDEIKNCLIPNTPLNEQEELRTKISELSIKKNKEWFKNIPGGEFLGHVVFDDFDNLKENSILKKNILGLIKWCNFGK